MKVSAGKGIGHTVPERVSGSAPFSISFRVTEQGRDVTVVAEQDGSELGRRRYPLAIPSHMLTLPVKGVSGSGDVEVRIL